MVYTIIYLCKIRYYNAFSAILAGLETLSKLKVMCNLSYITSNQLKTLQCYISTERNSAKYRELLKPTKNYGQFAIPRLCE